jgi:hypothetical protein
MPETLDTCFLICAKHGIHPKFRQELIDFALKGQLNNRELGQRIMSCENYKETIRDLQS